MYCIDFMGDNSILLVNEVFAVLDKFSSRLGYNFVGLLRNC
jgi:hypothetical protein